MPVEAKTRRNKGAPVPENVMRLWIDYKESPDNDVLRNELVLHYSPLIKYVAGRMQANLPNTVEVDDLNQWGLFGLFDAIKKFDLERGLKFETYAVSRIRGAIIDELRNMDWVPRSVRQKIREIENATLELEKEHNRTPTEQEIADHIDKPIADVQTVLAQRTYGHITTLDDITNNGDGDASVPLSERLVDVREPLPGETLESEEQRQILAHSISELPERDRTVLALYYYEGFTLADIGAVLGVTESRVCQLHAKALIALKAKMLNQ